MATLTEKLAITLNRRYLYSVARDVDALRFFLNNAADAESNGEGTIFTRVKPYLDGQIAKLVDRHSADEVRHEAMLEKALHSLGGVRSEVPAELRMVERMGEAAGNIFDRELTGPEDVAKAYLLLYAVERRAIERFTLMEEALREVYPEIADVFAQIGKDERTHMKYCVAVSKDALPDETAWTKMRDEMVELEATVFTKNSRAFMKHMIDNIFTTMSFPEKLFWLSMRKLNDATGRLQTIMDIGGAQELPGSRPSVAVAVAA
jgi:hypothetical protein